MVTVAAAEVIPIQGREEKQQAGVGACACEAFDSSTGCRRGMYGSSVSAEHVNPLQGKHVYSDPEDHAVKRQYGYEWWKHWAVLAQEVLTAIGQANEPGILLNSLLTSNSGVSAPARAHADAGLCFVYGYDAVLFEEGNPR